MLISKIKPCMSKSNLFSQEKTVDLRIAPYKSHKQANNASTRIALSNATIILAISDGANLRI